MEKMKLSLHLGFNVFNACIFGGGIIKFYDIGLMYQLFVFTFLFGHNLDL